MWNKLRARHYAIILLLAIVTLETSAIAIDRFLSKGDDTAFAVDGKFRNNSFLERFQIAEANAAPLPQTLSMTRNAAGVSRLSANKADLMPNNRLFSAENGAPIPGPAPARTSVQSEADLSTDKDWLEYTVKKGDSLAQIAGLFGVKCDLVASANQLKDEKLKAGRKIRIPLSSSRMIYKVKKGDCLSKVASRFGITIQDLIVENNLKSYSLLEDQELAIPVRKKSSEMVMLPLKIVHEASPKVLVKSSISIVPSRDKLQIAFNPRFSTALKIVRVPATPLVNTPIAAPQTVFPQTPAVKPVSAPAPAAKSLAVTLVKTTTPVVAARGTANDEIKIVMHTVKNGDNLAKLARQYRTSISQIVANNELTNSNLKVGKQVKVPVNKKLYRVLQVSSRKIPARTKFQIPVMGNISDNYGWRFHPVWRKRLFHAGIDIAASRGTTIGSSLPGQVVYAGWRTGYGKLVIVRHANGLSTRYGHCSSFNVRRGQMVRAGQAIARVGSTGVATGPHLHFEIRRNGKTLNPRALLFAR